MQDAANLAPPRWRVVVTWILFAQALIAAVISAAFLQSLIDAWSPLDPTYAGPVVPVTTRMALESIPGLPIWLGIAAGASPIAAFLVWRSRWRAETRLWSIQALAVILALLAVVLPMQFVANYFLVPKVANAALAAPVDG